MAADVEAEITLLPTQQRGRRTLTGYRPAHAIRPDYHTSGLHEYLDRESVSPGETARGLITFLAPEQYPPTLPVGQDVPFYEGSRQIGVARITRILNPLLDSAARPAERTREGDAI